MWWFNRNVLKRTRSIIQLAQDYKAKWIQSLLQVQCIYYYWTNEVVANLFYFKKIVPISNMFNYTLCCIHLISLSCGNLFAKCQHCKIVHEHVCFLFHKLLKFCLRKVHVNSSIWLVVAIYTLTYFLFSLPLPLHSIHVKFRFSKIQ